MVNLATQLSEEIMRVLKLRDEYISLGAMPNVLTDPKIASMTAEIEKGIRAAGGPDALAMMRVYENLKGLK